MKKLAVYGASGHGKVVAEIGEKLGYRVVEFIDDTPNKSIFGKLSISFDIFLEKYKNIRIEVALGIGNNFIREKIFNKIKTHNLHISTLIHPNTSISKRASIGEGTVIMAGSVVNAEAVIGKASIINTSSIVEHENIIGDFVHISPKVALAGNVEVDNFSHVGIGSSVIQNIKIGKNCLIGAGSVVIRDIKDNKIVVGNPASRYLN